MNEPVSDTTMMVSFRLNGEERTVRVLPDARLVDMLREHFALTATKASCRIGRCGSCLVLLNGSAVNSCLLMAWQVQGADIISPEALDALPAGRIVREALVAEVAFQCGYCAPGFAVAITALLLQQPNADDAEIQAALEGNICRCTGYSSILRGAILARQLLSGRPAMSPRASTRHAFRPEPDRAASAPATLTSTSRDMNVAIERTK